MTVGLTGTPSLERREAAGVRVEQIRRAGEAVSVASTSRKPYNASSHGTLSRIAPMMTPTML